jgi:hypothetical protein
MSDVPELDTTSISWFAYYDVVSETDATQIYPQDMTNADSVINNEQYDNGSVLTYTADQVGREITIRATKDGPVTAHMNLKENYQKLLNPSVNNPEANINGIHDLFEWNSLGNTVSLTSGCVLERAIREVLQQLRNWSSDLSSDYNASDINYHNYEYGPGNISVFSETKDSGEFGITFSGATTIEKAVFATRMYAEDEYEDISATINGSEVISLSPYAEDVIERGYLAKDVTTQANNDKELNVNVSGNLNDPFNYAQGGTEGSIHFIIIWS